MQKNLSLCQYFKDRRKPQLARNFHCRCSFKFSDAKVECDNAMENFIFIAFFIARQKCPQTPINKGEKFFSKKIVR